MRATDVLTRGNRDDDRGDVTIYVFKADSVVCIRQYVHILLYIYGDDVDGGSLIRCNKKERYVESQEYRIDSVRERGSV